MKKNVDLHQLIRPNILELTPYRSARDDFDSGILLDANENSFGSPYAHSEELNRYPMPDQNILRTRIADFRKVKKEQVFVGVGSDEAIDLLFRIFCTPNHDRVLITPPTYGMYAVSASINDVAVDRVLLTPEFQLDVEKTLAQVTEQTKLLFLCSPNNPSGNRLRTSDIQRLIEQFDGIVVLDEAYIDFCAEGSMAELVHAYPNLVILQTLSKAFGLAGIRLGIAIASPEIISYMQRVKAPYNVNKLTSKAAIQAFDHLDKVDEHVEAILKERTKVIKRLKRLSAVEQVFPTDANFLIFRIPNALEIYKKLAEEGVVVRYRGNEPHCENCLRLTIGTPDENEAFFNALNRVLSLS
jgi:histidinol-phosphate aminotransferase